MQILSFVGLINDVETPLPLANLTMKYDVETPLPFANLTMKYDVETPLPIANLTMKYASTPELILL